MKNLLKIIIAVIVLGMIIALPAIAHEQPIAVSTQRTDEAVRVKFADNMTAGFVKGLELQGRKVSDTERERAYRIAYGRAPEIFAEAKKAGLWEQYKLQMFDPEIREFDAQALKAKTIGEVIDIGMKQMKAVESGYPELYKWLMGNATAQQAVHNIIRTMLASLNG